MAAYLSIWCHNPDRLSRAEAVEEQKMLWRGRAGGPVCAEVLVLVAANSQNQDSCPRSADRGGFAPFREQVIAAARFAYEASACS